MNLQKIGKTLRAELFRNPKKTGVLALVTLVALYFWAPLVWKWVAPTNQAPVVETAEPGKPSQNIVVTEGEASSVSAVPLLSWQEQRTFRQQDPFMRPAEWKGGNPFANLSPPKMNAEEAEDYSQQDHPNDSLPLDESPTGLGLVLNATLVGPDAGVATISGHTFRLGETIALGYDEEYPDYAFELKSIESHRVVLTREGIEYPLKLKRDKLARNNAQ